MINPYYQCKVCKKKIHDTKELNILPNGTVYCSDCFKDRTREPDCCPHCFFQYDRSDTEVREMMSNILMNGDAEEIECWDCGKPIVIYEVEEVFYYKIRKVRK